MKKLTPEKNKVVVEITLNDKFTEEPKGLIFTHAILTDLVDNKFNEFSKSEVNEVHFVFNAPIGGEVTKIYEAVIRDTFDGIDVQSVKNE